jgi:hypothetical protein
VKRREREGCFSGEKSVAYGGRGPSFCPEVEWLDLPGGSASEILLGTIQRNMFSEAIPESHYVGALFSCSIPAALSNRYSGFSIA